MYFVKQIVGLLKDEGYDVREVRESKAAQTYLHEFHFYAVASDGTGFSDVVFEKGANFAKAHVRARRKFMDDLSNRVKGKRWSDMPLRITATHRDTYKVIEFDDEVVNEEDARF